MEVGTKAILDDVSKWIGLNTQWLMMQARLGKSLLKSWKVYRSLDAFRKLVGKKKTKC